MIKSASSSKASMKKAARSSLAADFPKVVIDDTAETRAELLREWPKSDCMLREFILEQVRSGRWERVYKRVNGHLKPAYRRQQ